MRAQRLKPSKVNPVEVWWQCCLPLTFAFLWIGMERGNIVRFDGAEESGSRLEMRTPFSMNSVTECRRRGQGMRDPLPDHGKAKKMLPKEALDSSQPKLGLIMPLTYRKNALPRLATHQNPQSNPRPTACPKGNHLFCSRPYKNAAGSSCRGRSVPCSDVHFRSSPITVQEPRQLRDVEPPYLRSDCQQDNGQHHIRAEQ